MAKGPKAITMHQHVGMRVKEIRTALGLTQAELGERLGWTGQVVSFVENGRRQLNVDELLVVARALGGRVIGLLNPLGDRETRVRLSSGETLDADGLRDTVLGAGAAEQRRKVQEEIQRRQEELGIPLLVDLLRTVSYEKEDL
jgi:transcriptional regulator with XRE-family HTH domain